MRGGRDQRAVDVLERHVLHGGIAGLSQRQRVAGVGNDFAVDLDEYPRGVRLDRDRVLGAGGLDRLLGGGVRHGDLLSGGFFQLRRRVVRSQVTDQTEERLAAGAYADDVEQPVRGEVVGLRRPGPPLMVRLAISWLTNALVLAIVAGVLSGVDVRNAGSLLASAAGVRGLHTVLQPPPCLLTPP